MIYKKQQFGTFNLHTIKTDKFKSCHVEIFFRNNVNVDDITKRNILFDVLFENNNEFRSKRLLNLKLEELYNASVYCSNSKTGNAFITSCDIDFIGPQYTEKGIVKDSIKLLFDMIFNPYVNNHEFDNKTVELAKKRLRDDINSVKESPAKQALVLAKGNLKDTPTAYTSLGKLDDIDAITPESLYDYYVSVLASDYVDIFVIGDLDMDEVTKYVIEYAKFDVIKTHKVNLYTPMFSVRIKYDSAKFTSAQSNIVVFLSLNNLSDYEKKYVANLYNMILGGGSLQTKLSKRLRQDNSLCYTVSSNYNKYDNMIVIKTAVDINSVDKAIRLIKECLKDMMKDITDEELSQAKELVNTSLNMNKDDMFRIIDNYYFHDISDLDDLDVRLKMFKDVSVSDLYKFAKKVQIATTFVLEGEENE